MPIPVFFFIGWNIVDQPDIFELKNEWFARSLKQARICSVLSKFKKFLTQLLDVLKICTTFAYSTRLEMSILAQLTKKAMASHSSTLAWRIPWTEEPGRLQSMGLLGVGHN